MWDKEKCHYKFEQNCIFKYYIPDEEDITFPNDAFTNFGNRRQNISHQKTIQEVLMIDASQRLMFNIGNNTTEEKSIIVNI